MTQGSLSSLPSFLPSIPPSFLPSFFLPSFFRSFLHSFWWSSFHDCPRMGVNKDSIGIWAGLHGAAFLCIGGRSSALAPAHQREQRPNKHCDDWQHLCELPDLNHRLFIWLIFISQEAKGGKCPYASSQDMYLKSWESNGMELTW